ncbi:hypothetical protein Q604_UNBC14830G0001, partial [human gut metagenome]
DIVHDILKGGEFGKESKNLSNFYPL